MAPPKKTPPGSITKTADAQLNRINNISNVSRAISRMQRDVDQKIAETKKQVHEGVQFKEVQDNMNQTLSRLNSTIGALTTGVARITADTARATADVIRQYGRAISQDISFNKKNVVAMALAQTSPLYGYFVAKFLETDVFKRALNRMKVTISKTLGAVVRPFKGRAGTAGGKEIPHMQTGGTVKQGGLAKLHAGETVVPAGMGDISDTLKQILAVQKRQSIYFRSVFGVWAELGLGKRILKKIISPFTIPWKIARMFRKTKGVYRAQLSKSSMPLENIAENVATLFEGLMWRLDNMMELMKANVEAVRMTASHHTGHKFDVVPGVRMRRPAFSLIRKAGKIALAPASFALKGIIGGALGTAGILSSILSGNLDYMMEAGDLMKTLTKKRGLYKKEPGFFKSMWKGIKPRSREELLIGEAPQMEGTAGGPGMGGNVQFFAEVLSDVLGGKKGESQPIWVIWKKEGEQYKGQLTQAQVQKVQTKTLGKIRDSIDKLKEIQRNWFEKVKKWKWVSRIMSLFGGAKSMITGFLGSLFKYAMLGAVAGGIGYWIGTKIKKWLDDNFDLSKRLNDFFERQSEHTSQINKNVAKESTKAKDYMERMKKGEILPEMAFQQQQKVQRYKIQKSLGGLQERVGFAWGTYGPGIQAGMQDYIYKHMGSYLLYDQDAINAERAKWLRTGEGYHWLGMIDFAQATGSPQQWGLELEEKFHKHMQKKLTPIGALTAPEEYKQAYEKGFKARNLTAEQAAAEKARQQKAAGYSIEEINRKPLNPEDLKNITKAQTIDFLKSAHKLSDEQAKAKYRELVFSVGKDSPVLYNFPAIKDILSETMTREQSFWGGFWNTNKLGQVLKEKSKSYQNLKIPTAESMGGAIPKATIATNEVQLNVKELQVGNTPLVSALIDQAEKTRKTTEKTGGAIMSSNTVNTTTLVNNQNSSIGNNINPFYSGDPYSDRTVFGIMQ